jgi:uncharacterized protein YgbK (DUF1537 family)
VTRIVEKIAIIADDLTGAADTGVQFHPFFEETVLLPYQQLSLELEAMLTATSRALSIYTGSRALESSAAGDRVRVVARQLVKSKSAWFYKKIDSCLRGNLGAETEALMDELGHDLSFIAPAFPQMGRTTRNNIHLVYGVPVGQTEISRDPVTPVTESRLSTLMAAQSRYPVGHMALGFLDGAEQNLSEEIQRQANQGIKHIIFDATTQAHLDRIARLAFSSSQKILPVGSAGLAASLAALWPKRSSSKEEQIRISARGNHLLVCGTTCAVTRSQIKTLLETYPYEEVVLEAALLMDLNQRDSLLQKASSLQATVSSKDVIIRVGSSAHDGEAVASTNRDRASEAIVTGLGFFVAAVLQHSQPGFLFATGGDTADAVLRALHAGGIRISGEIVTGMVLGKLCGGPMNGLAVVTKAGAFGHNDALVVLHETWQDIICGSH